MSYGVTPSTTTQCFFSRGTVSRATAPPGSGAPALLGVGGFVDAEADGLGTAGSTMSHCWVRACSRSAWWALTAAALPQSPYTAKSARTSPNVTKRWPSAPETRLVRVRPLVGVGA